MGFKPDEKKFKWLKTCALNYGLKILSPLVYQVILETRLFMFQSTNANITTSFASLILISFIFYLFFYFLYTHLLVFLTLKNTCGILFIQYTRREFTVFMDFPKFLLFSLKSVTPPLIFQIFFFTLIRCPGSAWSSRWKPWTMDWQRQSAASSGWHQGRQSKITIYCLMMRISYAFNSLITRLLVQGTTYGMVIVY